MVYYENNRDKLKLIPIDDGNDPNGKGPVPPTYENILKGAYQPLARPLFKNSGKLFRKVGYIALPDKAYDLALRRFAERTTGSVFGGHGSQVGVRIEELLQKE